MENTACLGYSGSSASSAGSISPDFAISQSSPTKRVIFPLLPRSTTITAQRHSRSFLKQQDLYGSSHLDYLKRDSLLVSYATWPSALSEK